MKATCKLCGGEIDTAPFMDNIFDEGRETRERTLFFQHLSAHIDPRSRRCLANNRSVGEHQELKRHRMIGITQDNGWFQRWRLLQEVTTDDPALLEKQIAWRRYLHHLMSETEQESTPQQQPESVQ